jgi:serine protease AprX
MIMARIYFVLFISLSIPSLLIAQTAPGRYWIQFTDKDHIPQSIDRPEEFLSPKSIERRNRLGLGFDERDLPIDENYVQQILDLGFAQVVNRSKWFNAITLFVIDTTLIEEINLLPFVLETRSVQSFIQPEKSYIREETAMFRNQGPEEIRNEYGPSFRQIEMLNGHLLHEMNLYGQNMHIAVLDAGWNEADALPCFDHIRTDNRILGRRDFVYGDDQVYNLSNHGTYVWSIMAGIIPDSLMGAAPMASYYLFRTEDPAWEYLVEEDNWIAAMEVCDSLGVDIINSSLGYSLFDDSLQNHSYADMDGNTTRISIAGDIAASKGILVVNSAGNSGDNPWKYITAPSDGDSVLCVGAVDANRFHASFSSFGPSSDGDVKPNVSGMGSQCVFASLDGTISKGNGTSFSSPLIAGMAACLWQSFPEKSNMEIFRAIEQSAHLYQTPNDSLGYGIPNFYLAYQILSSVENATTFNPFIVWPTRISDYINVATTIDLSDEIILELIDSKGSIVEKWEGALQGDNQGLVQHKIRSDITKGTYILRARSGEFQGLFKVVK